MGSTIQLEKREVHQFDELSEAVYRQIQQAVENKQDEHLMSRKMLISRPAEAFRYVVTAQKSIGDFHKVF